MMFAGDISVYYENHLKSINTLCVQKAELLNVKVGVTYKLLFISMDWDYVSELQPPTSLLFIPQIIYEYGEPRWNHVDRRKSKSSEKNLSYCHFVRFKSHMNWPERKPVPQRWEAGD
jgi:hypothetical protein